MPSDRPAELSAVPANRAVLDILRERAIPRPPDDPWALDGYELHAHPDLCERLDEVAIGQPGGRSVGLYGVPGLVTDGVIYAVALGTGRIHLRVPSGPCHYAIVEHGGDASMFGPGWLAADAWLSALSSARGTDLLRSWVAAAASMVHDDA